MAKSSSRTYEIKPIILWGDKVTPRKTRWLWNDKVPIGGLTVVAGNPGTGKTHLGLYMASVVTKGGEWPDTGKKAPQGGVYILTGEDSVEYSLAARMKAAGADMSQVGFVVGAQVGLPEGTKEISLFHLPAFANFLERALKD